MRWVERDGIGYLVPKYSKTQDAMRERMPYVRDDGGRILSGRRGSAGDCVARSISIASGRPYDEVYKRLAAGNKAQRPTNRSRQATAGKLTARNGISVKRKWFIDYMRELGFRWVPCAQIGEPSTVKLCKDALPMGRLVVSVSKHMTAVIDGVIHDTYDCSQQGRRMVYGYWQFASADAKG